MTATADEADLGARLAAVEERLTRLESAGIRSLAIPPTGPDPDDFWALHGLAARSGGRGAVLFTGTVDLGGGHYEWQQAFTADEVLAVDGALTAERLAALGAPLRLRLLQAVVTGTTAVADLAALPDLGTTGQLYHHLRQLVSAGWLRTAGRGRYQVPPARVVPLLAVLAAAGN